MALSPQRKVLIAVLGLAGLALASDRAFFAPRSTMAESATADAAGVPVAPVVEASESTTAAVDDAWRRDVRRAVQVRRRLEEFASGSELRMDGIGDAFRASWKGTVEPEAAPVEDVQEDPRPAFMAAHRLTAILGEGDQGMVMVDGRPLDVGDTLDGFTLVEIIGRRAVFSAEAGTVELELPAP